MRNTLNQTQTNQKQHYNQQLSTYSTNSHTIHQQQSSNNGIASMLSPRNLMKLFTKNIEQIASPRITSFIHHRTNIHNQARIVSPFNEQQIKKQFNKYIDSIDQHYIKYKNINNRKQYVLGIQAKKQRQRQELQTQIKISKIPQQYFKQTKDQQYHSSHSSLNQKQQLLIKKQSIKSNKSIDKSIDKQKQKQKQHLSTKLQQLLMMRNNNEQQISMNKNKKKNKQKRIPLSKKQQQLQEYLDQVQIIIYNKTQKYPDRYLHYLANLNHSDTQIVSLITKIRQIRQNFGENIIIINQKYQNVVKLQKRKKNLMQVVNFMNTMKLIRNFKLSSQNLDNKSNQINHKPKQNVKTSEIITYIQQYPKIKQLHNLKSIQQTLLNIQQLGKNIKLKILTQISKQIHKNLVYNLNNTYSKQGWLKNQLPKDVLMIFRMKPQIQAILQQQNQGQDQNMNNSFLNISVLDQSYCVGTHNASAKNQTGFFTVDHKNNKQMKQIVQKWKFYCQEYGNSMYKFEEQDQQIGQILQRSLLKYSTTFNKDLQDYISFIFTQKGLNLKSFPSHKDRICFIQPKFFNKISKVFFQALVTSLSYSISFSKLQITFDKQMKIIQQKINQIINMRSLTQYSLIQNHILSYQDVVQLLNGLDFWFEYAGQVSDKIGMFQDNQQNQIIAGRMIQFQQNLLQKKIKIFQQFLANLHKYALVSDLKTIIQKSDFNSVSIPVSSFILLDFIINWGQTTHNNQPISNQNLQLLNTNKINQVDQSFLGTSILGDLQNQQSNNIKKNKKFSIFKVIDKKLIIQGKQYKICDSLLLLSTYLSIYLKAKCDFPDSSANIDQRICQLIGFYIWYSKKMIFTNSNAKQQQHNQTHFTNSNNTLQNLGAATMAKSIGGLKTAVNVLSQTYKQYKGSNDPHSKLQGNLQNIQTKDQKHPSKVQSLPPVNINKKTVINLCMLANLCDLLIKFMDILNITTKPKKVDKVIADLHTIKSDCHKQIAMIPFLEVQQWISTLYQSRLKTRKQVPTKQTIKIIQTLQQCRINLSEYYDNNNIKKIMQNTVKIICKNYFGYLLNMEIRGKAQLKWFVPKLRQVVGDLYGEQILNLQKQLRY